MTKELWLLTVVKLATATIMCFSFFKEIFKVFEPGFAKNFSAPLFRTAKKKQQRKQHQTYCAKLTAAYIRALQKNK